MTLFLELYWPNIMAAVLLAIALSFVGLMLVSRSESLQAIVASQSSSFGITIGVLLSSFFSINLESYDHFPSLVAFSMAFVVFNFVKYAISHHRSKASEIFLSVFLMLMAANYVIISIVPSLESHFSLAFFGDIATATKNTSFFLSGFSLIAIFFIVMNLKRLMQQSFLISSSGVGLNLKVDKLLYVIAGILLVESTHHFGFLFTCSSLIAVPLTASLYSKSLYNTFVLASLIAIFSSGLGFLISLNYQSIPTAALIVILQMIFVILRPLFLFFPYKIDIRF